MSYLPWISDLELEFAVSQLLGKAIEAQTNAKQDFGKNVIDPFSAVFQIAGFEMNYNTWEKSETARQAQKTLQNFVGEFHQNVLGACSDWENKKTGHVIDLVSTKYKIIAEIKNKYNTISGGKLSDLYHSLENLVMPKTNIYKGFTGYYVSIIPKRPIRFNKEFIPSDKERGARCPTNTLKREIDGASFYNLVTGDYNALENLFNVLPKVIFNCSSGKYNLKEIEKLKYFFSKAFG